MSSASYILLIDDDETIRDLVTAVLGDEGYRVVAVSEGHDGLRVLQDRPPTMILLDGMAYGSAHIAFIEAYRQLPGPHASIYLFSAASDAEELAQRLQLAGYLAKPFDIDSLIALAARHGGVEQRVTDRRNPAT